MGEALAEAVALRRSGHHDRESAWLDAMPGLAAAVSAWKADLAPVRAAIPDRVEELIGDRSALRRASRFGTVARVLGGQAAAFGALDAPRAKLQSRASAGDAARRLRIAFERLGPSYIKLGQFISSGRGLFPDVLVDEFAACRDRCPSLPWKAVRNAVESELGPLDATFASFDETPIAAASIAQVHNATLLDGRSVVVKVQRPGIAREVEAHTRTMPSIARLVGRLFPKAPVADPVAVVRLFATTILEELDFRLEAQNMVDVALDLEAAGVSDVVVPHPVPALVTPTVLVMERLEGMHFDDLAEMQAAGIDTAVLLLSGLRALVEGATVFGRFHGDLHAGNVIALSDGRFGLVDFGICARLDEAGRAGLQRLLVGISTGDPRSQVHGLDALGALPDTLDRRDLIAKLTLAHRERRDTLSVDDLRDGAPRVMSIFTEHKLRLPPALVLFFKDVLYLNGSTRLLAPDLDLLGLFGALHSHFNDKYGSDRVGATGDAYGPPITEAELAVVAAEAERAAAEENGPVEPPTLGSVARRFGPEALRSALIPMGIFVGVDRAADLKWAILAVTGWTIALTLVRRARGHRSPLAWITLAIVAARGAAGAATGSGLVYFGPDIANNFVFGGLLLATVAARRPAIGLAARAFYPFPPAVRRHPAFRRIFSRLTLMWASYLLIGGVIQAWLILNVDPSTFLVWKRAVTIPAVVILLAISLRYPRRKIQNDPELFSLINGASA